MRIVADENMDGPVRRLRERGHDVVWMADLAPGAPDGDVVAKAADRVYLAGGASPSIAAASAARRRISSCQGQSRHVAARSYQSRAASWWPSCHSSMA